MPSALGDDGGRQIRPPSRRRDGEPQGEAGDPRCREKPLSVEAWVPVPQTDTGRLVEYTKALGRTLAKELGKLAP